MRVWEGLGTHSESHSLFLMCKAGGCSMMAVPFMNFGMVSSSNRSGGGCKAEAPPPLLLAEEQPIWGVAALDEIEGDMYLVHTYEYAHEERRWCPSPDPKI